MPTLSTYRTAVQRLLGTDNTGALYSTTNLNSYINTARQQVAMEGQCIRALPPISGPITAITVQSQGASYSGSAVITVSAPDFPSNSPPNPSGVQSTATVTVGTSGSITGVTVVTPGDGYFAPVVTFSDSTGSGAAAVAVSSGINVTVGGQEVYKFSEVTNMVAVSGSGIANVFMVNSISVLFGGFRYTLQRCSWSKYQALARPQNNFQDVPGIWAQFGQGIGGSVYVQPIPNTAYQWEWDVCCLPHDLVDDGSADAIPLPWDQPVIYYACYLAFQQRQRYQDAQFMFQEYDKYMKRARMFTQPRGVNNWYGRPFDAGY